MVTRLLEYSADLAANDTGVEADNKTPRQGQAWDVQEVYCSDEADVDVSLVINERAIINDIPSDHIPTKADGLPFNLQVGNGDDLQVLMSETGGTDPGEVTFIVVVDESNA